MKHSRLDFCLFPVIAALVMLGAAGCSRVLSWKSVSSDLATLDEAYRAGVLTKAEYEAKKAGLESQATALDALEKAVAAGTVSKDDYRDVKARLIANGVALAALDQAHKAGVLSDQEYSAKKAALMAAPSSASGTPDRTSAAASPPGAKSSAETHPAGSKYDEAAAKFWTPVQQKVDDTGIDRSLLPDTFEAAVRAAKGNPRYSVVSVDDRRKLLTVTDKTNGDSITVRYDETAKRMVLFDWTRFKNQGGTSTMTSSLGTSQMGQGSGYILPSWIPRYPGSTTTSNSKTPIGGHTQLAQGMESADPLKSVVDFYKTRVTGFKVTQSFLNDTAGYVRLENDKYQITLSAGRCCGVTVTTFTVNVEEK